MVSWHVFHLTAKWAVAASWSARFGQTASWFLPFFFLFLSFLSLPFRTLKFYGSMSDVMVATSAVMIRRTTANFIVAVLAKKIDEL